MPVTMMISEKTFDPTNPDHERVDNYPGHETGRVSHRTCGVYGTREDGTFGKMWTDCEHGSDPAYRTAKGPDCDERCRTYGPLYMATSYKGLVLETGEVNGYDDSDFYAVVWNPEKGCTERVTYASTRGWTYPNHAKVDATPEVVAAYEAWQNARIEAARKRKEEERAKDPAVKGKCVKVTRGRKVKPGTTGTVFWVGICNYTRKPRVGIRDTKGTAHWVLAAYCEVVEE